MYLQKNFGNKYRVIANTFNSGSYSGFNLDGKLVVTKINKKDLLKLTKNSKYKYLKNGIYTKKDINNIHFIVGGGEAGDETSSVKNMNLDLFDKGYDLLMVINNEKPKKLIL